MSTDPAASPPLTDFEYGRELGRRIREEHPMPDDLAGRLGELIRGARPTPTPRADTERTA
jgi:hypothetical protein